jgi:hypothetical protein
VVLVAVTALNVQWISDGFAELERAIEAMEWDLAWHLALFIDARGEWGSLAVQRLAEARDPRPRR